MRYVRWLSSIFACASALAISSCSKNELGFQVSLPDTLSGPQSPVPSPVVVVASGTSAPSALAWNANNASSVSVAWSDNATDGTGYEVQSCAGSGCTAFASAPGSPLAAHSTGYSLSGLSPSSIVRLQIRALGPNGPSAWVGTGDLVSFAGVDSADQVTPTSARLNWTPVTTAAAYLVYDVTSGAPVLAASVSAPATSFVLTALTPSTNYVFRVRTLDGTGAADHNTGDIAVGTPAIGAPLAPSSLVVGAVTSSSISLSWTDNATTATAYEIQRCAGSGCTSYSDLSSTLSASAVSYTDSGLSSSATYRYRVRATNGAGGSAWLGSGDITTGATVPNDPTALAWTGDTGSSISISWVDGGSQETGYEIQSCAGSGCSAFTDVPGSPYASAISSTTQPVSTPGATYRLRVRALNGSLSSNWLTSGDLVAFGGISAVTAVTSAQAQLNWSAVAGASAYLVYDVSSGTPALVATVSAPSSSHVLSSLSASTPYKYRVRSLSAAGVTDQNTNDVSFTTGAQGSPSAPTNLTIQTVTTSAISIAWSEADSSALSFDVQACSGSGCSTYSAVTGSPLPVSQTSFSYSGLNNASVYRLRVRAENAAGPSAWLTSSDIATSTILPPSNLAWTGDDASSVAFSWNDNAINPSNVEIQSCVGFACSSFADVSGNPFPPAQATETVSGLAAGSYYRVRVRAQDPGGSSAWVTSGNLVAFGGIGSVGSILSDRMTLSWSGVPGASAYVVYDVSSGTPAFVATVSAPGTSYTVTGLSPSTPYTLRVRSLDSTGVLDQNTHDVTASTTAPQPPADPTGIVAVPTTANTVSLSWTNNAPNATSYEIQQCAGSGCSSFADVSGSPSTGALSSFTVTNLQPLATYRFQVRAQNGAGSSSWLTTGDVTTPTSASPPLAPSNLVWASNTATTIGVSWTDNANNATGYQIQSCTGPGCASFADVSGSPFASSALSSYTLAALNEGTSYRVQVRATNSYGNSGWLTSPDLVAFGGIASVTSVTDTGLLLGWNAVGAAAGYSVYNTTSGVPVFVGSVSSGTTSYLLTGLTPATTYKFRVQEFSGLGVADQNTDDVSATTSALVAPAAPTGLTANTTTSTISISWTGNDPTTATYDVQACAGSSCSSYATVSGSPLTYPTASYAYTGLANASIYRLRVRATNAAGSSSWLSSGDIVTQTTLAPSNLAWSANDGASVSLTWTDNAISPTGYQVQSCSSYGCSSYADVPGSPFAPATASVTVGTLVANTYYGFRVRAVDAGGGSAWATSGNTVTFAGVSSASASLATQAQLGWSGVTGASSYVIYDTSSGNPVFLAAVAAPATSYTVTGLAASTAYKFRVRTSDASGISDRNTHDVPVTTPALTAPAAPTGLTVTGTTSGSIALSWTNNAPDATGYDVQECTGSGCSSYAEVSGAPFSGILTTYTATGLTTQTTYRLQIRAIGPGGTSAWVGTGDVTTPSSSSPPTAPANLVWSGNDGASISVTWTDTASNATAYQVQSCAGAGCSSYADVTGSPFSSTNLASYTLTGLTAGSTYRLQIRATNSSGNSAWLTSGDLVAFGGITSVSGVTDTAMQLNWGAVATAASYSIYNTTGGAPVFVASVGAGSTSFAVTGLTPATSYKFLVHESTASGAVDQNANSVTQATSALTAPTVPTGLVTNTTTSTIAISWSGTDATAATYDVQACAGSGCSSFATITGSPVSHPTASLTYSGLTNSSVYRVQVRATNAAGSSAWLTSGNITTQTVLAPTSLAWTGDTSSSVSLSWVNNAVSPLGTVLQSCSGYGCSSFTAVSGSPLAAGISSYTVTGLTANTYYTFRIQSYDAGGGSAWLAGGNTVAFGGATSASNVLATQLQLNWASVTGASSYTVYNTTSGTPVFVEAVAAPATSALVTGLTASTAYKFRVRTSDAGGNTDLNAVDLPVTTSSPTNALAPSGLTISGTSPNSILMTWTNNAPDATSYDVQQCTGSGCTTFAEVSGAPFSGIQTSYLATGLSPSTTYQLQIRANNSAGPSGWVGTGNVTTPSSASPPSAPSNLVWNSNTATTISVSWSDNANNATAYQVQTCTGAGCSSYADVTGSPFSSTTLASYTMTGLTEGNSYRIQVRATNSYGNSAWLTSGDLVAFRGIAAIGSITSTSMNLTWNPVGSAAGYTIYNSTSGSPVFMASIPSTSLSYSVTGLSPSTTYTYLVRSFTAQGVSDQNNGTFTQTTSATSPPVAPTNLIVGATTTSTIFFSWTDNDTTATAYDVQACSGAGCISFSTVAGSPLVPGTASFTYAGLTNATTYVVRVRADNGAGSSAWLTSGNITLPAVSPPTNLQWTSDTSSSVTLSWTDNAINPEGYEIQSCSGYNCSSFADISGSPFVPTTSSLTIGSLTAGTYYAFRIRTLDQGGGSTWLTSGNTVTFGGATSTSNAVATQLQVNWSGVTGAASYSVYNATSSPPVFIESVNAPATSAVVTGLTASTAYKFSVLTFDPAGNSDKNSATVSVTTPAAAPAAAPSALTVSGVTSSSVSLAWTNNAPDATGYEIWECSGSGCSAYAAITGSPFSGILTSYTINGLAASSTYRFQVRADNATGPSSWVGSGDTTTAAAPGTTPANPTNFAWTGNTGTSISFGWVNNASNATGYEVQSCSGPGCSNFTDVAASPYSSSTTSVTQTGLTPGGVYRFQVRALNANGNSAWLTSGNLVAFAGVASSSSVLPTSVQLNWSPPNNSVDLVVYNVTSCSPVYAGSVTGTVGSYVVTGLSPLTSYTFSVHSFDSLGNADQNAATVVVSTPAALTPADPSNLIVTGTATNQIGIAWTNNATNQTAYAVQRCTGLGCSSYAPVGGSPFSSGTTSFIDSTVTSGTIYSYEIQALGSGGTFSDWVSTTNVQASLAAPPAPTGLTISSITSSTMTVSWTNVATNATSVVVQRCSGAGCSSFAAVSGSPFTSTTTTFTDSGLTANTVYYYQVAAANGAGQSAWVQSGSNTTLGGASATASLVQASSLHAPHDGLAQVTLLVTPIVSGTSMVGPGLTVEVTASATATVSGAGACRTPSSQCAKATDLGNGMYSATAKSSSVASVTFTAVVAGSPDTALTTAPVVSFNTANFTSVTSGTTTATSANVGVNYYVTGGTLTFGSTTVGVAFGDLFVNGGTVNHTATTTGTMYSINIGVTSLTIQSGSINVNSLGYTTGYSWSSGGTPSTALGTPNKGGGSHGGQGGMATSQGYAATYDDYHNPIYPGGGGGNYAPGSPGGGVVKINSSGLCTIFSGGQIVASGTVGGAGGSINLTCAGYTGSAAAGAIQANGSALSTYEAGGGGGRIALISTASRALGFSQSFQYPTSATTLASFKTHVQAYGGTGGGNNIDGAAGNGGAGTVYLFGSDSSYGDLIVDNGSITTYAEGGTALLVSMSGTASANHTAGTNSMLVTGVSGSGGFAAAATNLYAGMHFRPDLTVTSGPPDNWSNDDVQIAASNSTTQLVSTTTFQAVASGAGVRSIDVLDHIDIAGNATLETYGDIWPVSGQLATPGLSTVTLTSGFIRWNGSGGLNYSGYGGVLNVNVASGSIFTSSTGATGSLNVSGSAFLGLTSNFTLGGALTTSGTSAVSCYASLAVQGDITIGSTSASALVATNVSASDLIMNSGTLSHFAATTGTFYSLNVTLTGTTGLQLNSGAINVNSLGYPVAYSWSNGGTPSTALAAPSKGGGSHGGQGGMANSQGYATTYDDYHNPIYPGGGGGNYGPGSPGGGVVRVTSINGPCTINTPATITANGTVGGAGGSINLQCAGFAGTAGSGSIQANGSALSTYEAGGGGGRIAMISSGTKSGTFSGNFAYPTSPTTLASFKTHVQAYGGSGGGNNVDGAAGNGGAGTIYLSGSDSTYGDLVVDNGGLTTYSEGGTTLLVSLTGTSTAPKPASTNALQVGSVSGSGGFSASAVGLYNSVRFRPDLTVTSGPPDNWPLDDMQQISSTDTLHVYSAANYQAVATSVSFRSIDVLDHIDVAASATLESYGDLWPVSGQLATPGLSSITLSNAFIKEDGGASLNYSGYGGSVNVSFASGTVYTSSLGTTGNLSVTGGTLSLSQNYAAGGAISLTGTGTLVAYGTLTAAGDITVNTTGTLQATTVNALDLYLNGGTITTFGASTSAFNTLNITLTGTTGLQLNNGTINVNSDGYPVAYSWSNGGTPSTALGAPSKGGGSHGGQGGMATSQGYAATYDDYRNPIYPGGGGGNYGPGSPGGGVVRVTSTNGPCTINTPGTITANGTVGGAGGSVNLQCAGFAGTAGVGAIQANGSALSTYQAGGGGGRIAMISSGTKSGSFTGNFTYPTSPTTLANFKTHVQAYGGSGGGNNVDSAAGNGGAGTIYLFGSDSTYGDLSIDDGGITTYAEGGNTLLVSVTGTSTAAHVAGTNSLQVGSVSGSGGFAASAVGMYNNLRFRPDLTVTSGPPDNWTLDDMQVISSTDTLHVYSTATYQSVASGVGFRSIDVLDHIDIATNVTIETYGDLWPVNGQLATPGLSTITLTNGFIKEDLGAGVNYPGFSGTLNVNVTGGAPTTNVSSMGGTLNVSAGTVTLTQGFTIGGGLNITGSGTLVADGTLTVGGDITLNTTGTLQGTTINAADLILNAGTITTFGASTSSFNTLNITLTGTTGLQLNNGTINVNSLGYLDNYSWSNGGTPSTALAAPSKGGGSHGGQGGMANSQGYATTYDDYHNPIYPGGGGGNYGPGSPGGGVVRVTSTNGPCTINSPATITANGTVGGAGGSINLQCAGFGGTAGTGAIVANGSALSTYQAGGGGGRIALISSGTKAGTFTGNFTYPTSPTTLASFKTHVQAYGGSGGGNNVDGAAGNGGAGTIYLFGSDSTYGDLVVDNGGLTTYSEGGTTLLVSLAGTSTAPKPGSTNALQVGSVTGSGGFASNVIGLYNAVRFRPDLTVTSGPPDNWTLDDMQQISSTDTLHVYSAANYQAVATSVSFRSIDVLDHIDVAASATLESYGDLWPVSGQLATPGQSAITLSNAFIKEDGGASLNYSGYGGSVNVSFASGTVYTSSLGTTGNLSVTGGTLSLSQNYAAGGAISLTGTGTLVAYGTLTAAGDITVNTTGTLQATTVNALDLYLNGGTIMTFGASTSAFNTLNITLTGTRGLQLNNGTINVNSLGYPDGYSWSNGGTPSTALAAPSKGGGSHGGQGGMAVSQGYASTYDDYHNPIYPGGGGGNYGPGSPGGGVVRVTSSNGPCTINTPGTITANGTVGGAGGSINLQCAGFAGTAGTSAVVANGSALSTYQAGGGGGRIALISSGTKAGSFSGNFTYPTSPTTLANFKTHVQAYGGSGGGNNVDSAAGNGGAGTIYLFGSDSTYGDLVIDGGGITTYAEGGTTLMVSLTGVASAAKPSASNALQVMSVSASGGFASSATNLYTGLHFRPDLTVTSGPPDNWTLDDMQQISSNDTIHVNSVANYQAVASGISFRSLDLLDHVDLAGGATFETYGDLWTVNGQLANPGQTTLSFTNGFIREDGGGSINYPNYAGSSNFTMTSGTLYTNSNIVSGSFSMSGGSLVLTSNFTIGGTLSLTGSASLTALGTLTTGGDITVNTTGTLAGTTITAPDLILNGGTITSFGATTSAYYPLNITLTGTTGLMLNAGTINVNSEGYTTGYSWSNGGTPSTAIAAGNKSGGSHGGQGGSGASQGNAQTYDDFRNPIYPGGGGGNYGPGSPGGGVVWVSAPNGPCTINTPGTITANGTVGGAGGTVNLQCAGFGGTAGSAAIQANGSLLSTYESGGGGGRIALISSGTKAGSFGGSFAYPTNSTTLASFKTHVQAYGGTGGGNNVDAAAGNGGPGTIYLFASNSTYGDLLIDNGGRTVYAEGGVTAFLASVVNSSTLNAYDSSSTVQITAASTPLAAGLTNIFRNGTLELFSTAATTNPLDSSHTLVKLDAVTANDTNHFYTSSGTFPSFGTNADYYRFLFELDHLDLAGNAQVNLEGGDLVLIDCDLHSSNTAELDVPSGSKLTGNVFASTYCSQTSTSSEEGGTINFSSYFLAP